MNNARQGKKFFWDNRGRNCKKSIRKDKYENYSRGNNSGTSHQEVEETVQLYIGTGPSPKYEQVPPPSYKAAVQLSEENHWEVGMEWESIRSSGWFLHVRHF